MSQRYHVSSTLAAPHRRSRKLDLSKISPFYPINSQLILLTAGLNNTLLDFVQPIKVPYFLDTMNMTYGRGDPHV